MARNRTLRPLSPEERKDRYDLAKFRLIEHMKWLRDNDPDEFSRVVNEIVDELKKECR